MGPSTLTLHGALNPNPAWGPLPLPCMGPSTLTLHEARNPNPA